MNKIKEIDATCKKYDIHNYNINKDGSIDVINHDVVLVLKGLKKLPLNFNIVNGNCNFGFNKLITLKGSPVYVKGDFDCSSNKLTSLKFAPKEIDRNFSCVVNKIKNLLYGPERVGINYFCGYNELISLKGAPKIIYGDFGCEKNKLTSLKHTPEYIYGNYSCSNNKIKILKGVIKYIEKNVYVNNNEDLYSFEGLPYNIKHLECSKTILYNVWKLFEDTSKIELFNDLDIIREDNNGNPVIILDRLNEFLDMIGKPTVKKVEGYINI